MRSLTPRPHEPERTCHLPQQTFINGSWIRRERRERDDRSHPRLPHRRRRGLPHDSGRAAVSPCGCKRVGRGRNVLALRIHLCAVLRDYLSGPSRRPATAETHERPHPTASLYRLHLLCDLSWLSTLLDDDRLRRGATHHLTQSPVGGSDRMVIPRRRATLAH